MLRQAAVAILREIPPETRTKSMTVGRTALCFHSHSQLVWGQLEVRTERRRYIATKKLSTPDFTDVSSIYKNKDWKQLLRALIVFNLASWPILASNHLKVLKWSRRLAGERLFSVLMRATIYGQFMAGERRDEVLEVARENAKAGIYAMFAYTASEQHGLGSALEVIRREDHIHMENSEAIELGLKMAASAKAFSNYTPQLSTKLTFLMSSQLLVNLSNLVAHQTALLQHGFGDTDASRRVEFSQYLDTVLNKACNSYGGSNMVLPKRLDKEGLLLSLPFHLELSHCKELFSFVKNMPGNWKQLSSNDENMVVENWRNLVKLGQCASEEGVSLIIDAEQTYLQKAIEIFAIDLMRKFNKQRPVIHNTYQCYLRCMHDVVQRDLDLALREDFHLGMKIVRGAYLDEETARAVAMCYESPINSSYEMTTKMYEKVSTTILEAIKQSTKKRVHVTFATHNLDSVKFVINRMNDLDLTLEDKNIAFAQLLGMRDYISFPLGYNGFLVAKLVHYGSVEGGIAYLARRLAENKTGLTAVDLERRLVWKEIKRRLGFL